MPLYDCKGAVAPFITQPVPSQQRMRESVISESALEVLMIDDTVEDRMVVGRALAAGGFVLHEALDAEHGLRLAMCSTPDCILLDYALPDANGLEVVESLRQTGGALPCAVVMLAGAGTADVATAAMKAGVLDYLVKDRLDADALRRAIRNAVRQFRTERRNAQLAAIVDASDDAIISVGTDLAVQTWNAGAERLFGYGEAEACGRTLTELIVPGMHDAETAAVVYRDVMSGRAALLKETVRRRRDGRLVLVETTVSPLLDGAGEVAGLSVVFRDMSERWRAEDPLRRLAMLFAVTSDLIRASEPGELGRMTFECVSSAFGADICFNFRFDPVAKRLNLVFGHGLSSEHLSLKLGQAFCGTAGLAGEAVVADKPRIGRDPKAGLLRSLGAAAYACYPLKASDGRLLGTFSVASRTRAAFTDDEVASLGTITNFLAQAWERLETEQDLRASEERLRLSQKAAGLGNWDFDFASGTLVWSDQTRKLLGVEPGAPASLELLLSLVHAEDRRRFEEYLASNSHPDSDQGRHLEFRIMMQNGGVRWLEDQSRMETNAAGMPVRAVGIIRDITERKNAEETQARLAAIVTSSGDAIIGQALDNTVTSWNEAAGRMYGYTAGEMIGQVPRCIARADKYPEQDMINTRLARGERIEDFETVRIAKDGRTIDVSISASPMRDAEGRVIGASKFMRDITARKHAEEQLRKSEERFRSSVIHSPLPILLFDDREQILALSQSWVEESGYSREELRQIEDWTTRASGARSADVLGQIRQIILTEPQAQPAELMIRTKHGRERIWSFVYSALGAQSDGRRLFVCLAQDVTERKTHDEQVQLLMREINHRSKNMLSLVQSIARQTAARETEDFIGRFTERIQALAANQDLLVKNEWQGVDVEDLVRAQLAHFADLVGSRIAVSGPKLRLNAASAQAIGLALHELATNAGKYGALSVDVGLVDVGWRLDGAIFVMSWTEHNGPPVSQPERMGFGSTVITSIAKQTVGGEVELDYAPSGLVWRLTCPAANVLERVVPKIP